MAMTVAQPELRIYPTTSVTELAKNYAPEGECYPFNGDKLAYYRHEYPEYDSFPVALYLV